MRGSSFTLWTITALVLVLGTSAEAQRRRRRPSRPSHAPTHAPAADEEPVEDAQGAPQVVTAPIPVPAPTPPGQQPPGQPSAPGAAQSTSPTDTPSNTPVAAFDPGPPPPDITPIRTDYVALMDDLVQARSRVSALGTELFRTRVQVIFQDRTGGTQALARFVVQLDGAPIFQSDGPVEGANDQREIFTGSVAPGPHVLSLEVEEHSRDSDAYRYTMRDSYRFEVARERLSEITLILEDGSDIARAFPAGGEGRYDVRTRVRVATRALPAQ